VCVRECVCVWERERERVCERESISGLSLSGMGTAALRDNVVYWKTNRNFGSLGTSVLYRVCSTGLR